MLLEMKVTYRCYSGWRNKFTAKSSSTQRHRKYYAYKESSVIRRPSRESEGQTGCGCLADSGAGASTERVNTLLPVSATTSSFPFSMLWCSPNLLRIYESWLRWYHFAEVTLFCQGLCCWHLFCRCTCPCPTPAVPQGQGEAVIGVRDLLHPCPSPGCPLVLPLCGFGQITWPTGFISAEGVGL